MTVKDFFSDHSKFARIAMCLTLVVVMSIAAGFSRIDRRVNIIADGQTVTVNTMQDDPVSIIKQSGVKLDPSDKYTVSTQNIEDGTTITIKRAVPVLIKFEDKTKKINTTENNVQSLLSSIGYGSDNYYVSANTGESITPNMLIRLEPLTNKMVFRNENSSFNTVYRDDNTMPAGTTKVIQQGSEGVNHLMVKEYYSGGQKVNEQVLQKSVLKEAVPQIIARGTYTAPAGVVYDGQIPPYIATMYVEASAYLPTDGSGSGYTATGMLAQHGVVAVDPNVIPLGTRMYIPGYGVAVAADTGGFSGNVIDLCVDSYAEAVNWGRRDISIYILAS